MKHATYQLASHHASCCSPRKRCSLERDYIVSDPALHSPKLQTIPWPRSQLRTFKSTVDRNNAFDQRKVQYKVRLTTHPTVRRDEEPKILDAWSAAGCDVDPSHGLLDPILVLPVETVVGSRQ